METMIFIANQLYKFFDTESLVKVGVCTAFLKDQNTEYEFGGRIMYENDHLVLFAGLPKRIEIDNENLIELFQYQHCDLLSDCYILKQKGNCKFNENSFIFNDQTYYDVDDLKLILLQ